ncbi:anti-sigma factor [Microbacterium hibisci]|uniref:anti-sigma factor n=1 Tax=Microbacterium hibisci TaxID=2036000 RepID=UPI001EF37E16|nr:anti-sigma factor [Microbacterium hibisci]
MDEKEFAELAAGAALNALSPADRLAFDRARREHPEWESRVMTDAATVAALADTVSDALPPLKLRSTLLSRVATTPQLPAMDAAVAAVAAAAAPVDRWTSPAEFPTPDAAPADAAEADATVLADPAAEPGAGPTGAEFAPIAPPADAATAGFEPDDLREPVEPDVDATHAEPVADTTVLDRTAGDRGGAEPPLTTTTLQAVSRRNWTRGILALAASMVLLVALGLGAALINDYLHRPPAVVALDEIESAPDAQSATVEVVDGGTATAHWSESVGEAVLVSQGLPALADDQSFETWFVRDGAAVSAGTFDAEDGAATVLLDGAVEPGDVIAVTVEPQGGSPTGEPTSDPIVQIPTA